MSELWPNLEERRTVVGPDVDEIYEASIREAAGFPTRFIYQDKTIKSLERIETITKILNGLPSSIICSVTSDIDILLLNKITKEQLIENAENIGINYTTRDILSYLYRESNSIAGKKFKPIFDKLDGLVLNALICKRKPIAIVEW